MEKSNAIKRFAALLELHTPPLNVLHHMARAAGFAAWQVFVEERLNLLDDSSRDAELELLMLSCREEFCNFTRYTRQTGGDGLEMPQLERLRQHTKSATAEPLYLLRSDALMRGDLSLAAKYASVTNNKVSTQLAIERSRYMGPCSSIIRNFPNRSIHEYVTILLEKLFGERGFASRPARFDAKCFEKSLGPASSILSCLENVSRLGNMNWRGEILLSFFVRCDGALEASYVDTCCQRIAGLPLRMSGLAPGLDAYINGGFLLQSGSGVIAGRDVVTIAVYEAAPTLPHDQVVVLAHVALAIDCYLTLFQAIERGLGAACIGLQSSFHQGL